MHKKIDKLVIEDSKDRDDILKEQELQTMIRKCWGEVVEDNILDSGDPEATYKGKIAQQLLSLSSLRLSKRASNEVSCKQTEKNVLDEPKIRPIRTDYEIIEEIARGGMGIVFRGRQASLQREIAIKKIIKKTETEKLQKFIAESLITAYLDHPNIVPVYDLGESDDGEPLLAMKLVEGVMWRTLLHPRNAKEKQNAQPYDHKAQLAILLSVCNAIAYSHSKGIVHNDLKPSNVMVGEFGEVLVMDWGLAVDIHEDSPNKSYIIHKSKISAPMGTPSYMPPELVIGIGSNIGPWTDVYLLGAILCEVLTGLPPHQGNLTTALLSSAMGKLPQFDNSVPVELQQICHQALARDIENRYQSVAEFRTAIQDYLSHQESIVIANEAEKLLQECQQTIAESKGKKVAKEQQTLLYGKFAEAISEFQQAIKLWQGNIKAKQDKQVARLAYTWLALENGDLVLAEAQAEELDNDNLKREEIIGQIKEEKLKRDHSARTSKRLRWGLVTLVVAIILGLAVVVYLIDAERKKSDEERIRANKASEKTKIAEQLALKLANNFKEERDKANSNLASLLYKKAQDHIQNKEYNEAAIFAAQAYLKDSSHYYPGVFINHNKLTPLLGFMKSGGASVGGVVFSPDESKIYTAHYDNIVRCWDAKNYQLLTTYKGHSGRCRGLALSKDGKILITSGYDKVVKIWNTETGKLLDTLTGGHKERIFTVALSPDDKYIASGSGDSKISIWELKTRKLVKTLDASVQVRCLKYNRDGSLLASAESAGGSLIFWNTKNWHPLSVVPFLQHAIWGLDFANDGKLFAAVDRSGEIQFRDAVSGELMDDPTKIPSSVFLDIAFSLDGKKFVTSGKEDISGRVKLWDSQSCQVVASIYAHKRDARRSVFSQKENKFVSVSLDGTIKVWKWQKHRQQVPFAGHQHSISSICLTNDSRFLTSSDEDGVLKIWDIATGKLIKKIKFPELKIIRQIAYQPNSNNIALLSGRLFELLDLENRNKNIAFKFNVPLDSQSASIIFTSDGKKIALAFKYGIIKLFSTTGKLECVFDQHKIAVYALAISKNDRILASGSFDKTINLYELDTGTKLATLRGHQSDVFSLDFNHKDQIVSGSMDTTVKLWDVKNYKLQKTFYGHLGSVNSVKFSPDGKIIVSGSGDKTIKLWDAESGQVLYTLHGHHAAIAGLCFSKDGRLIFSADKNGKIRKWELNKLYESPQDHLSRIQKITGLKIEGIHAIPLNKEEWHKIKEQ